MTHVRHHHRRTPSGKVASVREHERRIEHAHSHGTVVRTPLRIEGKYFYDDNESKTKWSLNKNLKGMGKLNHVIKYGDHFVASGSVNSSFSENDVKKRIEKGGFQYVTVDKKVEK